VHVEQQHGVPIERYAPARFSQTKCACTGWSPGGAHRRDTH
jgi:hypothetical protein